MWLLLHRSSACWVIAFPCCAVWSLSASWRVLSPVCIVLERDSGCTELGVTSFVKRMEHVTAVRVSFCNMQWGRGNDVKSQTKAESYFMLFIFCHGENPQGRPTTPHSSHWIVILLFHNKRVSWTGSVGTWRSRCYKREDKFTEKYVVIFTWVCLCSGMLFLYFFKNATLESLSLCVLNSPNSVGSKSACWLKAWDSEEWSDVWF